MSKQSRQRNKYLIMSYDGKTTTGAVTDDPQKYIAILVSLILQIKKRHGVVPSFRKVLLVNTSPISTKELNKFLMKYNGTLKDIIRAATIYDSYRSLRSMMPIFTYENEYSIIVFKKDIAKLPLNHIPHRRRIIVDDSTIPWTSTQLMNPISVHPPKIIKNQKSHKPAVEPKKKEPRYAIYNSNNGQAFLFVFNNKIILLPRNNYDGIYYLNTLLLSNEEKTITYMDLYLNKVKFSGTQKEKLKALAFSAGDIESVSEASLEAAKGKLIRLETSYEKKYNRLTDEERMKYDQKLEELQDFITKYTGKAGKPRKIEGKATQIKRTVKKSINELLLLLLQNGYRDFHDYLKKSINFETSDVFFNDTSAIQWELITLS